MSKLTFVEVPIHAFGIDLGLTFVCLSDGRLCFEKNPMFVPTYDYSKDGVTACFDQEEFYMLERDGPIERFNYGTAYPYKEMPTMLKWLVQQNMQFN
jgi:hypothetical protein